MLCGCRISTVSTSDYVTNVMKGGSVFDARLDRGLLWTLPRPSLGSTKLPIYWVPKITFSKRKAHGAWSRSLPCIKYRGLRMCGAVPPFCRVFMTWSTCTLSSFTPTNTVTKQHTEILCVLVIISRIREISTSSLCCSEFSAVVVKCLFTCTPCVSKYSRHHCTWLQYRH